MVRVSCCLSLLMLPLTLVADEPATVADGASILAAADDSPQRQSIVQLHISLLKLAGEPELDADAQLSSEELAEFLAQQKGNLRQLTSVRMSTLHNLLAQVQLGKQEMVIAGQTRPGFPSPTPSGQLTRSTMNAYRTESTGTVFSATPHVTDDGRILVELSVEQTELAPAAPLPAGEEGSFTPQGKDTFIVRTTLKVTPGKTLVAGATHTRTQDDSETIYLLIRADVRE